MTKTELEKKHLSDLHLLASEAGIEKYRLLTKGELVDRLAEGGADGGEERTEERSERQERPRRRRSGGTRAPRERSEREPRERPEKAPEREPAPEPAAKEGPSAPVAAAAAAEAPRPRRRRRRRFGRRKQGVTLQTLLLPPEAGRQALVFAETREGCTALLRSVAADLSAESKGPDPVALLIDPTPEELADWKREAPQAEIVSAGQPRHASDALAQAAARAGKGEDVILLVDSLTRLGAAYGDAEAAKEFFDAGRTQGSAGGGSLTVVAALERPESD
ncbi:MAG TPA: Rho termination factor N-terminal domain-containing protein [Solirubrobacterales bacterium]|nr:Rho termination factor N-terminal domain-containing protein [Solirubrobacterales bacterium]